jgi:hypothetical protein
MFRFRMEMEVNVVRATDAIGVAGWYRHWHCAAQFSSMP